jgi:hypothetical protein
MRIAGEAETIPVQNLDPASASYTAMTGFTKNLNLAATEHKLDIYISGQHNPSDPKDMRQTFLGEISHRFDNPHDSEIELNTQFYSVALQLQRCS